MWRIEGAAVLAWALRLRDSIPPASEGVDPRSMLAALPRDGLGLRALVRGAELRPVPEIMTAWNEWLTQWVPVQHAAPSEGRSRVLERCRALRWLAESDRTDLCTTPVR